MITVKVSGAKALAARFERAGSTTNARLTGVVAQHAQKTVGLIRAKASGRPGPRAQTGNYRRSWSATMGLTWGGPSALVSTNAPQANRLEHGFVGVDSLGRRFDQGPFPHVGPAVRVAEPEFVAAVAAFVAELGRG